MSSNWKEFIVGYLTKYMDLSLIREVLELELHELVNGCEHDRSRRQESCRSATGVICLLVIQEENCLDDITTRF